MVTKRVSITWRAISARPYEAVLKVQPGLSTFSEDPSKAGESLQPLFEFAESHVPAEAQHRTPVLLMATAGLRTVEAAAAEAILESCRQGLTLVHLSAQRKCFLWDRG